MEVALRQNRGGFYTLDMKAPLIVSALFHVTVFVFATVGIPYIAKPLPLTETPIVVEIFTPDDVTEALKQDDPEKAEEPPPEPPKKKPVYNQENTAPDLLSPKPPEIDEELVQEEVETAVHVPAEPERVERLEEKPLPDPHLIKVPPKPKAKPKPPKLQKVETPPEDVKPKVPERDITSLLKSLAPDEPEPVQEAAQQAPEGVQMTSSDEDRLNASVERCWNINAGGRNAESLIVALRVFMNPDRHVREVRIVDTIRYGTDQHYRAAADAARRALLDKGCQPLDLPPEKYDLWKSFPYTFDPSGIL